VQLLLLLWAMPRGGHLSRQLGEWQVICWALVLSAPFLVVPVAIAILQHGLHASWSAWLGFSYVSVFSMFLGFFAWYHGLAIGGVARVSQMQLLQPFLTIFASALFLQEQITMFTIAIALLVLIMVALGKKATIRSSIKPI
jgi:drug/metabolite transporter (DMT)-like permease